MIRLRESPSPLLKWHNVDRWLKIGEKRKRRKYITAKKISTRKVHLQLKISETFDRCINSMNSLSLSTTGKESFVQIIQKSSNIIKDAFVIITEDHYDIIAMIAQWSSGIITKVPNTEEQMMICYTAPQHFSSPAGTLFVYKVLRSFYGLCWAGRTRTACTRKLLTITSTR